MLWNGIIRYTNNKLVHLYSWSDACSEYAVVALFIHRRHLERCDNSRYRIQRRPRACAAPTKILWTVLAAADTTFMVRLF